MKKVGVNRTPLASAAEQIRAALAGSPEQGMALRVAARRGEDGEIEYGMGLDERRDQDEEVLTDAGITLLVSPPSLEALAAFDLEQEALAQIPRGNPRRVKVLHDFERLFLVVFPGKFFFPG